MCSELMVHFNLSSQLVCEWNLGRKQQSEALRWWLMVLLTCSQSHKKQIITFETNWTYLLRIMEFQRGYNIGLSTYLSFLKAGAYLSKALSGYGLFCIITITETIVWNYCGPLICILPDYCYLCSNNLPCNSFAHALCPSRKLALRDIAIRLK